MTHTNNLLNEEAPLLTDEFTWMVERNDLFHVLRSSVLHSENVDTKPEAHSLVFRLVDLSHSPDVGTKNVHHCNAVFTRTLVQTVGVCSDD